MDRAFLALVTSRLKELEKAQLAQATARASGLDGYGQGAIDQAHSNLSNALRTWNQGLDAGRITVIGKAA